MALLSQVSTSYPRVLRDSFAGHGHVFLLSNCPDTDSLCCQHPSYLFTDVDRCIMISVHLISTLTVIDMPFPDEAGHLPVPANLLLSEMDIPFYTWPVCVLTFSLSFHTLESYHQASDCTENDNSQMFCQEVSSVLLSDRSGNDMLCSILFLSLVFNVLTDHFYWSACYWHFYKH